MKHIITVDYIEFSFCWHNILIFITLVSILVDLLSIVHNFNPFSRNTHPPLPWERINIDPLLIPIHISHRGQIKIISKTVILRV